MMDVEFCISLNEIKGLTHTINRNKFVHASIVDIGVENGKPSRLQSKRIPSLKVDGVI